MGKHLPVNKKYKLAINVLQGKSYAEAGRMFEVSRQTAMDVSKDYFPKIFPLIYEREMLGINFNELSTLRRAWSKVRMD